MINNWHWHVCHCIPVTFFLSLLTSQLAIATGQDLFPIDRCSQENGVGNGGEKATYFQVRLLHYTKGEKKTGVDALSDPPTTQVIETVGL